jgi:uncharacterized membrane protein
MQGYESWLASGLWILGLLILLGLVLVVRWVAARGRAAHPQGTGSGGIELNTAAAVEGLLKKRYESGEISREEFEGHLQSVRG